MNTILQATSELLKSKKFQPAFTEDGNMLFVAAAASSTSGPHTVDTSEDNTIITLLSRVPVKAPPAKRAACAKLVARFNYGKRQGAFHLDFRDGEVLFCISNVLNAGIAPEETLDALFGATYCAMNEHAPEIFKLIYGRAPVPDAEGATRLATVTAASNHQASTTEARRFLAHISQQAQKKGKQWKT